MENLWEESFSHPFVYQINFIVDFLEELNRTRFNQPDKLKSLWNSKNEQKVKPPKIQEKAGWTAKRLTNWYMYVSIFKRDWLSLLILEEIQKGSITLI